MLKCVRWVLIIFLLVKTKQAAIIKVFLMTFKNEKRSKSRDVRYESFIQHLFCTFIHFDCSKGKRSVRMTIFA